MGETFNIRDYKLLCAIAKRFAFYKDGIVRAEYSNGHTRVFCYDKQIFHFSWSDRFFEATTRGKNEPWVMDKLNACLSAVGILARVYTTPSGLLRVVRQDGRMFGANMFNSKIMEVK